MNEEKLLYRLSCLDANNSHPKIDVVNDVLRAVAQKRERQEAERPLLWLAGGALAVTAMIILVTFPSFNIINSPWASILNTLPEVLL